MIKEDLIEIIDEIMEKKKYSNIQINHYFKIKNYNEKEKAFFNNLLNITLKNIILIDYIISKLAKKIEKRKIKQLLRISIAQIMYMDSDNKGVVYEAVELAKKINVHQGKFVNQILRKALDNIEIIKEELEKEKRYDIIYSYPIWFVNKIKETNPDNYIDIMKSYKSKSYLSVRINPKKITRVEFEGLLKDISTEIVFQVEDVYYLSNNNIFNTKEYKMGDVIIQDASSYIVAKNINGNKNDIIYDACAAPGGKSMAILDLFSLNKLIASDIHGHKIEILEDIKKKKGYDNLEIIKHDAREIIENYNINKILLDVPCSGLGVLRKKPEKIYNTDNTNIKAIKKIQKDIFDAAYNSLDKDGEIIYSTCTIIENENTNNVKYFLEKYKDLETMDVYIPDNVFNTKDEYGGVYIDYRNQYLDGFYIVKFKKK